MDKWESEIQKNFTTIPIGQIRFDDDHIRKYETCIEGLKYTISDVGLMQPIIVRRTGDTYTVIDGHRRLMALKELNVAELILNKEVLVSTDETEADNKFRQIIANVQREDIDDIGLGYAFVALKEEYGYYYNEIAHIIGKTPHYVTSKVNLVKRLTEEVRAQAILDREAAKCNRDTVFPEQESQYVMGTKVLEDIARLPAYLQMRAYNDIKSEKRKKDDALAYLRELKQSIAERPETDASGARLSVYLDRVNNDLDELDKKVNDIGADEYALIMPALELMLEKLHQICFKARREKPSAEGLRCETS